MTSKRVPPPKSPPQSGLPHDEGREGGQPYAKEVDDYAQGVAKPPKEDGEPTADSGLSKPQRKR